MQLWQNVPQLILGQFPIDPVKSTNQITKFEVLVILIDVCAYPHNIMHYKSLCICYTLCNQW